MTFPIVAEKKRIVESYDYKTPEIDYNISTEHLVSGTHYVKCTDEEFRSFTSNMQIGIVFTVRKEDCHEM